MTIAHFACLAVLNGVQEPSPIAWSGKDVEMGPISVPVPDAKATVLLFIAVDCPIANRYGPEFGRLRRDFAERGARFVRVYVDGSVPDKDIVVHGTEFALEMPAVKDGKHALVALVGATVTPEAAVIGPDGMMVYRGRITDLYTEHGRFRESDIRQDLRIALDEFLAGKPVSEARMPAIGCGIPDGGNRAVQR